MLLIYFVILLPLSFGKLNSNDRQKVNDEGESKKVLLSRAKRDGKLSTRWISRKGGIDVPITLRSLITCLTPGLNDLFCFGPRVSLFEPRDITLTKQKGVSFGYNNGVDLRFLEPFNIPLIGEQTNIGDHIGATVKDNGVEFGPQSEIFQIYKHNLGGVVEYDKDGVAVDIGPRVRVADDAVKLQLTLFGINVGTPQGALSNPLGYPYGRTLRTQLRSYDQTLTPNWDRLNFNSYESRLKTPAQRACPWCVYSGLPDYQRR